VNEQPHGSILKDPRINENDKSFTLSTQKDASELIEQESFLISPNPSGGNIALSLNSEEIISDNMRYVITDLLGTQIANIQISNLTENYEFINMSSGVYIVHLIVDEQIKDTNKVVLNK
jgi:hypothetical protein